MNSIFFFSFNNFCLAQARARAGSSGVIHAISTLLGTPEQRSSPKFKNILGLLPTLAASTENNLKV